MSARTTAILWTLAILAACSVPGEYIPSVPLLSPDKIVHVALFGVFGWLWSRAYPNRSAWILAGGAAFGVFIEIWQQTLPIGRYAELNDIVADLVGLSLVVGVLALRRRFWAVA